ncbi:venom serine protease isoform X2 [Drosophila willistoni]|uniref:venom serine protease isoform X2 n=1 Tax=Drosophila willistoni TaxID=7260 RepID=UPI001F08722B|nr:venom serine protease isoform X2 [Drosophila willistoni]
MVTREECIYYVKAPVNHFIEMNCHFKMIPDACSSMFILTSEDGDLKFRDADRFCRSGRFTKMSSFQYFALKLYFNDESSSERQQKLKITCEAKAVTRSEACDCGWCAPPDLDIRIGNGRNASKNEFPFLVAIQEIGSYIKIFCGGSIVSNRHIVTAAHCTKRQPLANNLMALVGAHDLNAKSKYVRKHSISLIINHPNYVEDYNDIALLLTRTSMEWSWGVAPVCLPFLDTENSFVEHPVEIAGWGSVKFGGPTSDTLLKANLFVLENDRCNIYYNNTIEDNQLCTTDRSEQGMDSLQMDSGGPVILRQRDRMFLVPPIRLNQFGSFGEIN